MQNLVKNRSLISEIYDQSHFLLTDPRTVERQWLEHLWDHENIFETGVVRANES